MIDEKWNATDFKLARLDLPCPKLFFLNLIVWVINICHDDKVGFFSPNWIQVLDDLFAHV
jgi:hypothetical protein